MVRTGDNITPYKREWVNTFIRFSASRKVKEVPVNEQVQISEQGDRLDFIPTDYFEVDDIRAAAHYGVTAKHDEFIKDVVFLRRAHLLPEDECPDPREVYGSTIKSRILSAFGHNSKCAEFGNVWGYRPRPVHEMKDPCLCNIPDDLHATYKDIYLVSTGLEHRCEGNQKKRRSTDIVDVDFEGMANRLVEYKKKIHFFDLRDDELVNCFFFHEEKRVKDYRYAVNNFPIRGATNENDKDKSFLFEINRIIEKKGMHKLGHVNWMKIREHFKRITQELNPDWGNEQVARMFFHHEERMVNDRRCNAVEERPLKKVRNNEKEVPIEVQSSSNGTDQQKQDQVKCEIRKPLDQSLSMQLPKLKLLSNGSDQQKQDQVKCEIKQPHYKEIYELSLDIEAIEESYDYLQRNESIFIKWRCPCNHCEKERIYRENEDECPHGSILCECLSQYEPMLVDGQIAVPSHFWDDDRPRKYHFY